MIAGMNLLPPELQQRSIRRRVFRMWTGIVCAASAAVLGLAFLGWQDCQQLSAAAVAREPQAETVRQLLASIQSSESLIGNLETELAGLSGLRVSVDPLAIIACLSHAADVCRDELQFTSLTVTSHDVDPDVPASTADVILTSAATELSELPQRESIHVTITGLAASDLSIARLAGALHDEGVFHAVTQEPPEPAAAGSPLRRRFRITCLRREVIP